MKEQKAVHLYSPKRRQRILNVTGIFTLLLAWFLLSNFTNIDPLYLPSPQAVWGIFVSLLDELPHHIGSSMNRIMAGFFIGSFIGIAMGMLIGWNKTMRDIFEPLIEFIRPMPPLALIPLFILWFGIGSKSKIIVIAFGAWVVMIVATIEAVRNIDPIYINASSSLGAKGFQLFRTILLPAIIPEIMASIRVVAANSFGMSVAAEFMGTNAGFGYLIIEGRRFIRTDLLFVGVLLITICSMIVNAIIKIIEKRLTRWVPRREQ